MALRLDLNDSTPLDYLWYVSVQGGSDTAYDGQMLLRQFISVPVGIFNNPTYNNTFPSENLNTSGALAIPTYRVRVFQNSLMDR